MKVDCYSTAKSGRQLLLLPEGKGTDAVPAHLRDKFDGTTIVRRLTVRSGD